MPHSVLFLTAAVSTAPAPPPATTALTRKVAGKYSCERETFGGNGRTCRTCHSEETGTVSPQDARKRFQLDPDDPLFVHDGGDDGDGHGVTRMLKDATILATIQMATNVKLAR